MKPLANLSIGMACDHAGYQLKEYLKDYLKPKVFEIVDFGTDSSDSVDYPDFGHKLGSAVNNGKVDYGIAICGSGNGISMTVNKYRNVRAALCWKDEIALLARQHNDANIISLPARFISEAEAERFIDTFFSTDFEGGRHERRVTKIAQVIQ
ncbi:MAG: ribose 5-phosphate isomerase B [Paludibacteraceae bacterium]|jgi:ribose 5-phosphate isomerase B|nr:ribose 5-phosphate isomerase B [Paludibacteraceae bacterium]MBQ6732852.1 ribose 5-phosphate isomerase B [Paludibacteraceae bacterium]MBQ6765404.1 ribose 5-phosphate isomerase B [Paludibacteraceae bacterium]MDY6372947.1 ribose 5-phosphate isomerase B [Bacteroidales bacterium]MDY6427036.1 ribose 5-phosphate isomerase B [Bacteroidales bacterium]